MALRRTSGLVPPSIERPPPAINVLDAIAIPHPERQKVAPVPAAVSPPMFESPSMPPSPAPLADPDRLAGSVLVGGFDGTTLPIVLAERLARGHLAGVIVFRRNLGPLEALCALSQAVAAAGPPDGPAPLFSLDQEGGRVARLGPPVVRLPPMRTLGRADDLDLTTRCGRVLGAELSALGVTLNFAPVCDVDSNPDNPVIGDRAFGVRPETVAAHAVAFLRGMQSAGVAACAKHFPGHGDTSADSHLTLPVLGHPRERLEAVELAPFRAAFAAGVATVMTAHVRFDALDPDVPATLSPRVVEGLLRGDLAVGRDDLVIVADDLLMRAVADAWTVEDAAVAAIAAGCDLLLVCADPAAQERARLGLADRARRDPGFCARLAAAAGRVTALRTRYQAPKASAEALHRLADTPVRRALETSLRGVEEAPLT